MSLTNRAETSGNALDLLEAEDLELRRLFAALRASRGSSVEERAKYGDLSKEIIRHLATREAALVDVSSVASDDPNLEEVSNRMESGMREHRPFIDRVEKMSLGVQGINLRVGQDFDGEMDDLMHVVGAEMEWELSVALPDLETALRASDREDELKTAEHLAVHAPTNLHPDGPRWWERAPIISRLITIYDRLRDFPREAKRHR
jgi:hypothetical protein